MRSSLFDIQVNGFAGVDFQKKSLTGEQVRHAVEELAKHETLRIFATLITDSIDSLAAKFCNFERIREQDKAIRDCICGYHLEGPWLNPAPGFRGAHNPSVMSTPRWEDFQRLQDAAGGNIRLVTLAPELPGAVDFVRKLTESGVLCSIGHSDAPETVVKDAMSSGLKFCTHLGNGAPTEMHRHDNIIQRLLAVDDLIAFFIPDGIHLPPWCLKNFFRAKPTGKALFTTDCMAAAGAPAGTYTLGEITVVVGEDRVVRKPGSGGFAGSALAPDEGVDKASQMLGIKKDAARNLFSDAVAAHFNITLPQV